MDFFAHQDQARKQTGRLVFLFFLAVTCLIGLLNILIAFVVWWTEGNAAGSPLGAIIPGTTINPDTGVPAATIWDYITLDQWLMITLGGVIVVGGASLVKWLMLRGGGKTVAESLGGRLINTDTQEFYERRVLNVVEEMAIAAGMPVPPVYIMPDNSINAFAAGYQASDAVIGVTRGCVQQLSRKQLQGVIAHEFSHIFNGDMRLNIRLMAILFGILFIGMIGRFVLDIAIHSRHRRSSNNEKGNPLPIIAIGIALIIIGYAGVFFGNLIKAAVSRQREFLADASAVQFTRDPETIGGALKVIGHGSGSDIDSSEREETAHMFFGQAMKFRFGWFKTHPPIEERIQRIEPNWDGQFIAPQSRQEAEQESPDLAKPSVNTLAGVAAAVSIAGSHMATSATLDDETPVDVTALARLDAAGRQTYSARALIFTLLLASEDTFVHEQQLDMIRQQQGQDIFKLCLTLLTHCQVISPDERLPLVEKAIPALKQLSPDQYQSFRQTLVSLAKADGNIDIFEWCLYRLVLRYLEPVFTEVTPARNKYNKPEQIYPELAQVLSYLAHYGHESDIEVQSAFQKAVSAGGFDANKLNLQEVDIHTLKPMNVALAKLVDAYPHVKGRIIKSLVACVKADGEICPVEKDLVRTLAAILECPVANMLD